MKIVARITAVVFLFIGLVVILVGVYIAVARNSQPPQGGLGMVDVSGMVMAIKAFAGGMVALQGLFLGAIGEGLWLLADIAEKNGQTSNLLAAVTRRRSGE